MDSEPDRLDAGELSSKSIGGARRFEIDPEFILFPTGRDFGVSAGVDVRIDSNCHRSNLPPCGGDLAQPAQLGHRFDIDLVNLGGHRSLQLDSRLAHS